MRDTDDIRKSIIEFWRAVLISLLAFSTMVVYIFASSKIAWKREQERLELIAKQKAVEKMNKIPGVCAITMSTTRWRPFTASIM